MNNIKIVYIILLCIPLGFLPGISYAQKTSKAVPLCEKAGKSIQSQDYVKAMDYLNQAQSKDPYYPDIYIMKGDVFNFNLMSDSAMLNYQRAIDLIGDPDPMLYYIAGNEGAKCGAYEYALKSLELFLQKGIQYPDVLPEAQKTIANCKFAIESKKNPRSFELMNMGSGINSEWDEYLAAITADDEQIVFTVKRPRDKNTICAFCLNEEDLYCSRKLEGEWLPREELGSPVKTGYNEGAQCISPDGKYLLYTMCDADFGMGSCDLYWAKRIGDRWSRPRNFGAPVNTSAWESQPTMAANGMTIYFASSRPGGFGGMDIWKTTMTAEGEFSVPENLGPVINTPGDDAAPFIHSDGRTLYFASNGRVGMGGYDLYYSTMQTDGTWSEAVNMGYPINTPADEINIFINALGTVAYISSDKDGGFGGLDLYSFELDDLLRPNPVTYIKGHVRDAFSGEPLAARIEMIDLNTKQILTSTSSDSQTGSYLACVHTGGNILLNVSHPDYPFYSENFQIEKTYTELSPFLKDIVLQPTDVGTVVTLKNVFFDFDKAELKPESFVELDKLVSYLQHNTVRIEIGGHTDNHGSEEYNDRLSENRAKAVYDYLVQKGIPVDRLTYKGYGMRMPVADNDTEEGRAANRRTEFKIIRN
ncbi:MAG: OmpA family protein [Bacteroidales bacterium]|jgi:outer membrane protein OmpA-like peptidoglycan-associated protein|nr:OmpA family protein [Bacteroidales bacterium]